jgi:hypothetical protein
MQNDHTLTVSSKKVEKEYKSTEDSDVELGSAKKKVEKEDKSTEDSDVEPKKKDRKKMKKKIKDPTLTLNCEQVENKDNTNEKSAKELAIMYLKQWKNHKDEWKFQKVRQVWCLSQ